MITACQSILLDEEAFTGKIILCIPCDEEGLMLGIKHFIKQGWADGVDGAIICEPEENQVCIAQRGAIRLRVDIYGKMAHGAISWSGINPNWRMARFITEMEKLEKRSSFAWGGSVFEVADDYTDHFTCPGKRRCPNQCDSDHCMTTLDIRTVPAQDHDELLAKIEAIIDRMKAEDPDFNVELTVLDNRPATATDKDEPVVQAIYQAVKDVLETEPRYNGVPGATDGTFLHVHGVPIVTIGAGDREIPHQIDEYVDIEELAETTAIYRKAALLFWQVTKHENSSHPWRRDRKEVMQEALLVLETLQELEEDLSVDTTIFDWSSDYYLRTGRMMPEDGLTILADYDAILFGAIGDTRVPDDVTVWELIMPIRKQFDQYVNFRPVKSLPGIASPLAHADHIDFVIFRENTEGEYSNSGGRLYRDKPQDLAIQNTVMTKKASAILSALHVTMLRNTENRR